MLKYTTMTRFLILHQMANEIYVTWEMILPVVLGYYIRNYSIWYQ